jgi:hypothetical protein
MELTGSFYIVEPFVKLEASDFAFVVNMLQRCQSPVLRIFISHRFWCLIDSDCENSLDRIQS